MNDGSPHALDCGGDPVGCEVLRANLCCNAELRAERGVLRDARHLSGKCLNIAWEEQAVDLVGDALERPTGRARNDGESGGHSLGHTDSVWNPALKAQQIKWGDIIPAFYHDGGQFFAGQNLTELGGPNRISPREGSDRCVNPARPK